MNQVVAANNKAMQRMEAPNSGDYLVFELGRQAFCISVDQVRDVIRAQKLTPVPLSATAIAGVMNLRGHIVTAVDARVALDIPRGSEKSYMNVVVEFSSGLYSIMVDKVRDVISLDSGKLDANPSILEGKLQEVSNGVLKYKNELIVCLDVSQLFNAVKVKAIPGV